MACPNCFSGGVTDKHPQGIEQHIHGRETYIAQPDEGTNPKGIIVFITDAFGWKFPNNRVLADHYAKRGGYLVYIPDFMDGNAVPEYGLTLMDKILGPAKAWMDYLWKPWYLIQVIPTMVSFTIKCSPPKKKDSVFHFLTALRTSPAPFAGSAVPGAREGMTKPMKIGVAGFCWGGKFCTWFAQDDPASRVVRHESQLSSDGKGKGEKLPLIDCAFVAHPSFLDVPSDIEAIKLPYSCAVGDNDMAMGKDKALKMKEILAAKPDAENLYQVDIIPGAAHGFAVRCHPDDEHEMKCAMRAEDQALAWFDKWVARD